MRLTRTIRRSLRPAGKTAQAVWRWKRLFFSDAPPVFGNSKPKSGSHLLLQVLAGMCQVAPHKYVEAEPIRTITKEGRRRTKEEILNELKRIPRGVLGWGYVEALPANVVFLGRPGVWNSFFNRGAFVTQFFSNRPLAGWGNYRTPVKNLTHFLISV